MTRRRRSAPERLRTVDTWSDASCVRRSAAPQRDAIEEAAKWIRDGGIVALPTDTLYGLAADPFRADAVARVFAVKGRAAERALPLIAADAAQVDAQLGRAVAAGARGCGPVLAGSADAARRRAARRSRRDVTGGTGTRRRARAGRRAWRARSAARARTARDGDERQSSAASRRPRDPDVVERTLGDRIDLLIDAGRDAAAARRRRSSMSRARRRALVRAGAIPWEEILEWLNTGPA